MAKKITEAFFLGDLYNSKEHKATPEHLMLDSKDLMTHAVIMGMTGSGKTGLGISLLEEASLDAIPSIAIDPKGDLGNLLLTFPHLSKEEFLPWIDKAEAERQGLSAEDYAESVAKTWKDGLKKWDESEKTIQQLKKTVKMEIYTPASEAGTPLSVLNSFNVPSKETMADPVAVRESVMSVTSSLLGLLGIDADPIKSKEHVYISCIFDEAWRQGINFDLPTLIQYVLNPPFQKVGALDLDTFYSKKERQELSIRLNSLLAAPGFQAWMKGEPLDIENLLYTDQSQPKLSIISIAHLTDTERMFFMTLFLNQLLGWMRKQPGTTNLKSLLYVDEIYGYFPPSSMPPSKVPMLTLLKQARAFGLGIVLATQNPVDLDYKGLANCGTWFIGKLQTAQDKARVADGLKGIMPEGEKVADLIDQTGKRIFLLKNIHSADPVLFETRWTLSYLRGPMTLAQIAAFKEPGTEIKACSAEVKEQRPRLPKSIEEAFLMGLSTTSVRYRPRIAAIGKVHYVDRKYSLDTWKDVCMAASIDQETVSVAWDESDRFDNYKDLFQKDPVPDATFQEIPPQLLKEEWYKGELKSAAAYLYQNESLEVYGSREYDLYSKVGETKTAFQERLDELVKSKNAERIEKIKQTYQKKIDTLTNKLRDLDRNIEKQSQQATMKKAETFISMLSTFFSFLFRPKVTKTAVNQAGQTVKGWGRAQKESAEVTHLQEESAQLQQQLDLLAQDRDAEIAKVNGEEAKSVIDTQEIKPRKSDVIIERLVCLWSPF